MALWARFTDDGASKGVVVETFRFPTNPNPLFVPSWVWVEAPEETVQQSTFDGSDWVHPDPIVVPPVDPDPTPDPDPDPVPYYVPVPLLRQRLEKLGMFEDFAAYLALNPPLSYKVLTLEKGVDPAFPDLFVAFDAMSVPQSARDYLLANPSVGVPDIPEDLTNG